ncbi:MULTISPECIES: hypothetical protein [Burkholderia cepacia complex]|uniref:hypothetical protein n=1 Tax=Burkholderia cepacia complex TaxID=87882 RepID=UPI00073A75C0|nr:MULTISPECIES: hypothetical protein [Burkholderia cepacia complex]ALV61653.1 hypothetical protein TQ36_36110 [Burkholderia cenocepacia]AQQ48092.1 hypothetical protein A8F32_19700 [Burkholderia cenocepacia]ONJ04192.1 hypothetical protein A8F33_23810 [Burkholderia cenocepacia]ONJ09538.1 hypothetical protein A8F53_00780 [Burkholderia cenocepacia]ONJ29279.1 hypothetical protein A8F38_17440 [Burkholderia cenocepacia]
MDDRYVALEKELAHVKNAIQTLQANRKDFPYGTTVGDPAYWRARLQSIRRMAERYNHLKLRDRADELLIEVSKLQYWSP